MTRASIYSLLTGAVSLRSRTAYNRPPELKKKESIAAWGKPLRGCTMGEPVSAIVHRRQQNVALDSALVTAPSETNKFACGPAGLMCVAAEC